MIRLDGHARIDDPLRGGVIALGNFDGFHAGHQAVVGRAVRHARDEGRPAIVATFDPHPVRFFKPDVPPFRLTTLDQRQELFAAAGADAMLVLPFDATLAATSAEDFITGLLLDRYGAAGVVTGADFVFGKGRGGDVVTLADHARRLGFFTEMVAPVDDAEEVISSSRIREALQAGDCAAATRLLTRPFTVRNIVQHGDKNGRLLGFPTAKELLEPHFFDFAEDLYGQEIDVAFHAFIRPEAKYDGMDTLMTQIAKDCDEAKRLLACI
ncbi:MAG: bifunctional riboflavin kinase/FMN adenylyltransferase [Sphingomonadales bacterium]|nr:MAG: bifunctional riboflavin kinase/FMN adenylyltransferase [Sphingomonadales bacterium]